MTTKATEKITTKEKATIKDKVLKALNDNSGEHISGEALSEKLGVSRAAIWKGVKALRKEGYNIAATTNRGYIMLASTENISSEMLEETMKTNKSVKSVFVYDTIDSTNIQAKRLILEGKAKHGSIAFANGQTEGRGRLGRRFHSPQRGIYMSIIIRPDFDVSRSVLVTIAAAEAVAGAIAEVCGGEPKIKWVNDIYLEGRKVCGILTEATTDFETGFIDNLIIGIGINTSIEGFPAELRDIAGSVDAEDAGTKARLIAKIAERTMANVGEISGMSQQVRAPKFMDKYREMSMVIGREIMVYKGAYRKDPTVELGGVPAKAVNIDDAGGLRVQYKDGTTETLTTGEISIRV